MISGNELFQPTFAPEIVSIMSKKNYQDSAMRYAMWYLEHLLKMEDVMGKKLEMKIDEMLDRKIRQFLDEERATALPPKKEDI